MGLVTLVTFLILTPSWAGTWAHQLNCSTANQTACVPLGMWQSTWAFPGYPHGVVCQLIDLVHSLLLLNVLSTLHAPSECIGTERPNWVQGRPSEPSWVRGMWEDCTDSYSSLWCTAPTNTSNGCQCSHRCNNLHSMVTTLGEVLGPGIQMLLPLWVGQLGTRIVSGAAGHKTSGPVFMDVYVEI